MTNGKANYTMIASYGLWEIIEQLQLRPRSDIGFSEAHVHMSFSDRTNKPMRDAENSPKKVYSPQYELKKNAYVNALM